MVKTRHARFYMAGYLSCSFWRGVGSVEGDRRPLGGETRGSGESRSSVAGIQKRRVTDE